MACSESKAPDTELLHKNNIFKDLKMLKVSALQGAKIQEIGKNAEKQSDTSASKTYKIVLPPDARKEVLDFLNLTIPPQQVFALVLYQKSPHPEPAFADILAIGLYYTQEHQVLMHTLYEPKQGVFLPLDAFYSYQTFDILFNDIGYVLKRKFPEEKLSINCILFEDSYKQPFPMLDGFLVRRLMLKKTALKQDTLP
jgi:hypothetical protein